MEQCSHLEEGHTSQMGNMCMLHINVLEVNVILWWIFYTV